MRHLLKNSHIRDNVAFVMIAIAAYLAVPTIVHAEVTDDDLTVFTQPVALSRGSLAPAGEEAYLLNQDKICPFVTEQMGWPKSECRHIDAVSFFYLDEVDTLLVMKPTDEGYIKTDDWLDVDKDKAIKGMQAQLEAEMRKQSKRVGVPIDFVRWIIYPSLDKRHNILYYAFSVRWGDEILINAKAVTLDREGRVPFLIIPLDSNLAPDKLRQLIVQTVSNYQSSPGHSYAEFTSGDKVAAIGAVGLLASMLGVKYGKAASAGIGLVLLALAKKAWFVIAFPFLWLFKKLRKPKG